MAAINIFKFVLLANSKIQYKNLNTQNYAKKDLTCQTLTSARKVKVVLR